MPRSMMRKDGEEVMDPLESWRDSASPCRGGWNEMLADHVAKMTGVPVRGRMEQPRASAVGGPEIAGPIVTRILCPIPAEKCTHAGQRLTS